MTMRYNADESARLRANLPAHHIASLEAQGVLHDPEREQRDRERAMREQFKHAAQVSKDAALDMRARRSFLASSSGLSEDDISSLTDSDVIALTSARAAQPTEAEEMRRLAELAGGVS